ncbi:MAG: RNA polymerase sigma factor [Polyangiaceae bacterium]|nr:RNA polymerase sigma factor [Polyangiaceae bacterium]
MLDTDPDLLHRFREGDRAALSAVYLAYYADVHRLVRQGFVLRGSAPVHIRGLVDPDEQQDVVQEVFAKAFSPAARHSYDGWRPYRPFLLQIARNVRIDHERRRWREVPLLDATDTGQRAAPVVAQLLTSPSELLPDALLDRERTRSTAASLFAQLDPESQRFALLRFVDDLSQDEVAREMVVTRRRVRTLEGRLRRGIKRRVQVEALAMTLAA